MPVPADASTAAVPDAHDRSPSRRGRLAPVRRRATVLSTFSLLVCLLVAPARAEFVTAEDGTRIFYVQQGEGEPVLVAPMALYLEPYLLGPLSADRRVVFYDPRNRGRSDAGPLETVSLDRQVADLEELRQALGLERFALLGWSGLGMEMAVYALRHPDRVTHLVQLSPVPPTASILREAGDDRADRVDRAALEALDARADAGEFDTDAAAYCRARNRLTDPAYFVDTSLAAGLPDVCAFGNEWPVNLWPYFGALLPSFGDYDWRDALRGLDIPRLVIHGREDGIPLAGAIAWVEGYRNARLIELSPAGHFPFVEQNAAVVGAIDEFLSGRWPVTAQRL